MITSGTHRASQEREARGFQFLWSGLPPAVQVFTLPAVTRVATTRQEVPSFHPVPFLFLGRPPAIGVLQGTRAMAFQEQPWHSVPGSLVRKTNALPIVPGSNTARGYIL